MVGIVNWINRGGNSDVVEIQSLEFEKIEIKQCKIILIKAGLLNKDYF